MTELENRVASLEKDVADIKSELKQMPRFRPVESTEEMVDELIHESVKNMHDGMKKESRP